jgi:hypothetical protein
MKSSPTNNNLNEENSPKLEEKTSSEEDILKKPEDNPRYGDWVKNGRTIDF